MNVVATSVHYERYVEKLNLNFHLFWVSFFIFVLCRAILSTYITSFYVVVQGIQSISILVMLFATVQLVQFKVRNELLGILLFSYFIWCTYIIFNGFVYEYDYIKSQIFHGFFKYFFPIVLLFPKTIRFYRLQFNVIFYGAIAFLILNLLFFDQVTTHYDINVNEKFTFEGFVRNLGVPIGFLLITFIYHSKVKVAVSLVSLSWMLGIAIFRARRAIMVIALLHLLIFLAVYYLYANRKFLIALFFVLFTVVVISYSDVIYRNNKNFFATLEDRNTEDTRTGVEVAFRRDFEAIDWAFGRGIDGKYWCPNIDIKDTTGYRTMIETDYLNIILKGGILHLGMLLLFMVPAMINNLFRSNNLLSKASGIWIFLWILSLYPMNVFNFDINYMLVWSCVCIGFSPTIRRLSDSKLKKLLTDPL
ncbi:hypothetical protein [Lunatimonas salinarum]|uniref:hypothetical protein n=1 Tax=Lunatimonas salinarum TaxID=1774590 RepID=UPI001ADEC5F0|nr:hypothetical protein [Lunatimonas salinarum]